MINVVPQGFAFDGGESHQCKFVHNSRRDVLTVIFPFGNAKMKIDDMICDKYAIISSIRDKSSTLHMLFYSQKSSNFAEISFKVPNGHPSSANIPIGHPSMDLNKIQRFQMEFTENQNKHRIWFDNHKKIYSDLSDVPTTITIQRNVIFSKVATGTNKVSQKESVPPETTVSQTKAAVSPKEIVPQTKAAVPPKKKTPQTKAAVPQKKTAAQTEAAVPLPKQARPPRKLFNVNGR